MTSDHRKHLFYNQTIQNTELFRILDILIVMYFKLYIYKKGKKYHYNVKNSQKRRKMCMFQLTKQFIILDNLIVRMDQHTNQENISLNYSVY